MNLSLKEAVQHAREHGLSWETIGDILWYPPKTPDEVRAFAGEDAEDQGELLL